MALTWETLNEHPSITLLVAAIVSLALGKIISVVIERRKDAARAREWGCQDAAEYPQSGFLGLKAVREMMKADKDQLFPDLMVRRQEIMSEAAGRVCPTFTGPLLGQRVFFTSDPKNIQAMLATQFPDYDLGPARRGNMIRTLGDGIFVQDGKAWEHSRALLRPNFVRDQVSDLELEERHVRDLMRVLPVDEKGWTAVTNLQTLFFRLTIDSATEFLFGESVDSQLAESTLVSVQEKDELAFSKAFDVNQAHMAHGFRLGDLYWLYNPKEFRDNNKTIKRFIDHWVQNALKKASSEKELEGGHRKYVFAEAVAKQTQDPEEIAAQMLNILLAGRDTTASLLSWLFKELLRHPEVFQKLRAAIIHSFGTYDDPKEITFATLKDCQYLQHCMSETLRLWAVVPGNGRRSNKPTTLPRGGGPDGQSPVYIPADTEVQYSVHVMHRRKDIWGEDANEFKPERFLSKKPGWEFLPFNGGPRICIGQQFALTEAGYVVVRLLQRFDKIEPAGHELTETVIKSNLTLTSCPGNPTTLRLHEARA